MTNFKPQVFKIVTMFIISLGSALGFYGCFGKPVDKVGSHLENIKELAYKHSLKKLDATIAAKKIMFHMNDIKKLHQIISDNEPSKELLTSLIKGWDTEDKILKSITDGNHHFMIEVNAFFIRGHVKSKDGWKTLFPIFKP